MLNRWSLVTAAALVAASGAIAQNKVPAKKIQPAPASTQAPVAQEITLKVGDIAPPLTIAEWVKGDKVEKFEKGKIYVVEFWATWCGPCKASIPHLTKLQKEFKDKNVVIMGVASSERGTDSASKLKLVKDFVKSEGDAMNYRVAFDPDRAMSKAWMQAAGEKFIPRAFLVGGDGHIAWIGDPREGLDDQIKKAIKANKQLGAADNEPLITLASQPAKEKKPKPTAQAPAKLKVGDKAPALSIEEWLKGKKIDKFEEGRIYVIEFWATWCPPCRESIPHLTKLQKDFKDKKVTVIGVASDEHDADAAARKKTAKDFVDAKGDEMNYTVAFDADSSMSAAWMAPAGQRGIPCAFVVGSDGKIAWIGHPMNGLDEQVKKAVQANKKVGALDSGPVITLVSQPEPTKKDQPAAKADGPTIKLGDKAPALDASEWLQGQPISGFEKGRVYVVEFWSTRNLDSRRVTPFLSEIQKKFKEKGVTVVGVSRKDRTGESAARVTDYLKTAADRVQYTVAFDADAKTAESWSKAAGQRTMPQAFVVTQEGTIGWMGNPARGIEELEEAVALAVNGKLTPEASKGLTDKWKTELQKKIDLLEKRKDAQESGDYKAMIEAIDKLVALDKVNAPDLAAEKFETLYLKLKDVAGANTYAAGLIDGTLKNESTALNTIAWTIVDPANEGIANKDLKLALKAAMRADELTKHQDAYILDTLAKVYFDSGDLKKATELQEKAVKNTPSDDPNAGEIKERLEQYQKATAK